MEIEFFNSVRPYTKKNWVCRVGLVRLLFLCVLFDSLSLSILSFVSSGVFQFSSLAATSLC